jgi:hypothetical protein
VSLSFVKAGPSPTLKLASAVQTRPLLLSSSKQDGMVAPLLKSISTVLIVKINMKRNLLKYYLFDC